MTRILPLSLAALLFAAPASAQLADVPAAEGPTVYDGNWLGVAAVGVYMPSYDGSDDYVFTAAPLIQGELFGVGINPRAGGIALDFIPDPDHGVGLDLGVAATLRSSRASQVKDPVVASLGKLKRAIEVGPSVGFTIPKLLNAYDSFSVSTDVQWDVMGAHGGMVVGPAITYFTPVSRGAAVALTLNAEYGDNRFMDYYYSVTPAQALASGLSTYDAGAGFTKAGARVVGGIDLDGDLTNGGLSLVLIGGYSRMLGDAKDSPFTSERGSANQWLGAVGFGYIF